MKKILLSFAFFASIASAEVINAVAIVVENEAITLHDIEKTMKDLNINKDQAKGILINDRLERAQIKKFGIFVNEFELNKEIEKILQMNRIDLDTLKLSLKSKNKSFDEFKNELKKDLEKKRLYEGIAAGAKLDLSTEGLKNYYNSHLQDFTLYSELEVKIYKSNDPKLLEQLRISRLKHPNIREENALLNTKNADPRLLALLSRVNNNNYSTVLNSPNGYEMYYIKTKNNPQAIEFELIKNEVTNAYVAQQKQAFIQDFLINYTLKLK